MMAALLFSLLTLLVGFLIGHYQMVEIIDGYDPQTVADKAGLAKWVGSNLLMLGFAGILIDVVAIFTPGVRKISILAFVVILIAIAGRISMGNEQFVKE